MEIEDDTSSPKRLSTFKLLVLASGAGGPQMFWSTIMANLPLQLHSLGISKSFTSIILVSGPLSGCTIGPIAGVISDRLRSRWGRRRPIVALGAACTSACLMLLAWTDPIVRSISCEHSTCGQYEVTIQQLTRAMAILFTLAMSVSVQPMQSGIRSLMVEQAPSREQSRVSAWGSRMSGLAGILGLYAGSLSLPEVLHLWQGATQFQALALLNCVALSTIISVICFTIKEPDSRLLILPATNAQTGLSTLFAQFSETTRGLSARIQAVCQIQFCAWFAWFSVLYGMTTYISELQSRTNTLTRPDSDRAAQVGSFASMCFAIVGLIGSFCLPSILSWLAQTNSASRRPSSDQTHREAHLLHRSLMISQSWLALLLLIAPFLSTRTAGTTLMSLCGLSWAVTQWVPWAIIGQDIQNSRTEDGQSSTSAGAVLGIFNIAISLPQVLAGLCDSAVYSIAEAMGIAVPTSWVFVLGACAAICAAILARRLL